MTLSTDQLAAIRARAEAATKGPWEYREETRLAEDALAEAEADIRHLLVCLERARVRIVSLEQELRRERVRGVSLIGQLLQPDEAHDEPADQQQYRGHDGACEARRTGMVCDCGWGADDDATEDGA